MRKNVILIDFESVQPESMEALAEEHFTILLFVGSNQAKISFELASSMQKMGSRATYIRMSGNGPNALDFHIAFYMGRLSAEDPSTFFHIVSKDKGFDPLIAHLKAKKILSQRSESIATIPLLKNGIRKTPAERAQIFISKLREPKVTRPRTDKTLSSSIKAHFRGSIEDREVPAVIKAIESAGFLSIADGKVSYQEKVS